jgi:hypothetical protein
MALGITVRENEECTTIRIHGSDDFQDWLWNFRTMRTIGSNLRVNRMDRKEALQALRLLRPTIAAAKRIKLIGHSRGAAIALIMQYELRRTLPSYKVHMAHLYGGKRVGNQRFMDAVDGTYYHLRNRGDWIPFLPPWYAPYATLTTTRPWQGLLIAHGDYPV